MQRMHLVSLLVVAALVGLSKSTTYRRRDPIEILLDSTYMTIDSWDPAHYYGHPLQNEQTEVPKIDTNFDDTTSRTKKIGSLSITNPMDVLRQRFLLELQRRRQMQQQEQAKANREILNDIGKRSTGRLGMIYPRIQTRNSQAYQPANASTGHVAFDNPLWNRLERFDWYNVGNSGKYGNHAAQSNKCTLLEMALINMFHASESPNGLNGKGSGIGRNIFISNIDKWKRMNYTCNPFQQFTNYRDTPSTSSNLPR